MTRLSGQAEPGNHYLGVCSCLAEAWEAGVRRGPFDRNSDLLEGG